YSSTTPSGTAIGTPITGLITGTPSTTGTVYATSQCLAGGQAIPGCQPLVFPISIKDNSVGASTTLPSAPNSIFLPAGQTGSTSKLFLGSTDGLMIFSPGSTAAVVQIASIPGKILAMSPNGDRAIVTDLFSQPHQIYIVSGLSGTGTPTSTPILTDGITAAAFSPDGLKLFLIGPSTLYVYSTFFATKAVSLAMPATAISFFVNGSLAYFAGPNGVSLRNACDTTYAQAASFPSGAPTLFTAIPDGIHAVGVESPGVDVFTFTTPVSSPPVADPKHPQVQPITCPFTVTGLNTNFVNLGQGPFTPLKLLIAPDDSKAYILASNLGSVFVLDLEVNTVSAIPLIGNPVPLDAALTSDGSLLYVGTNDGSVHVLSTISMNDLNQVTFTNNNPSNKSSLCSNVSLPCNPDLIIAKP
ncbi:MAG TPA: WD40 repeat domain-containing protein, partial [Terriglobales bacterium]|nr:WD40 repeat domain-containing protein [Terriglobales bacterium]